MSSEWKRATRIIFLIASFSRPETPTRDSNHLDKKRQGIGEGIASELSLKDGGFLHHTELFSSPLLSADVRQRPALSRAALAT
jgi:hypothetical protein